MEVADFVADSEEEEEEREEELARRGHVNGARLVADEREQQSGGSNAHVVVAASTHSLASDAVNPALQAIEHTTELPGAVESTSEEHSGENDAEETELPVHQVGTIIGATGDSHVAVEAAQGGGSSNDESGSDESDHEGGGDGEDVSEEIVVGSDVYVEARTWPGINKQGGAGRVTAVHRETEDDGKTALVFYDVRYIFGGVDKRVESTFVQLLWKVLQEAKREKVGREYYHDEYIEEPLKKKRKMEAAGHTHDRKHVQPPREHKPAAPRAERRTREPPSPEVRGSTSASAFDGDDEVASDGDQVVQKVAGPGLLHVDEGAFLLSTEPPARPHAKPAKATNIVTSAEREQKKPRDRHRKRGKERARAARDDRRSIPNMNGTREPKTGDDASVHARRNKKHKQKKRSVDRESSSERVETTTTSRKRRYVGGYLHGGDDPDATFIQPEDNPTALPDDVARETQFVLADTKEGLRRQVDERLQLFNDNLASFARERAKVDTRLRELSSASVDEVRALHWQLSELEAFMKRDIVQGGEDVINSIMIALEKRHVSVAETVEFSYDKGVKEIQPNSAWLRDSKASVENAFIRRHSGPGVKLEFDKEESAEESNFSDASSDSNSSLEAHAVDNDIVDFVSDGYKTGYFDGARASIPPPRRRGFNDGSRLSRERTVPPKRGSIQRRNQARVRSSTTMDDFYEVYPLSSARASTAMQTNFRLVGQRARLSESNPWAWHDIAMKKRERVRAAGMRRSAFGSSARMNGIVSTSHSPSSRLNRNGSKDTSGTVQASVVQMRNNRFRSPRQAHPPQQPQPLRVTARSSLHMVNNFEVNNFEVNNFEPSARPLPITNKRPREIDVQSHVSDTAASANRVSWDAVFAVLSAFSMDLRPHLGGAQASLLRFGHLITNASVQAYFQASGFARFDFSREAASVTYRASRLRQQLADLRLQEFEVLESLPGGAESRDEEDVERTPAWLALHAQGDAYHRSIAELCVSIISGFQTISSEAVIDTLSVVLDELLQLLRQLPDCESVFVECREYFFYFDGEAPDSKTTPLLSAVSRTYWYVLQLLFALQRSCDGQQFSVQTKKHVWSLLEPALDWVKRAVMLFLVDWFLYLPSSHVLPESASDKDTDGEFPADNSREAPALSLWLLVFRCCRGDDETLPAKEEDGKEFWVAMKKLYCDNHIMRLASHFIRGESSGGYLVNSAQEPASVPVKPADEEGMQVRLLSLDSTWDLFTGLMELLKDETERAETSESVCQWEFVRDLLHADNKHFLPFDAPSTVSPQDYAIHFGPYALRTLQRVLWISERLPPDAVTVQAILQLLLDNVEPCRSFSIRQLPHFFKVFVSECSRTGVTPSSKQLLKSICGSNNSQDELAVLCQIILTQLGRHEKPIARRRFRQPVFQVIQTLAQELASATANAQPAVVNGRPAGRGWEWVKQDSSSASQTTKPNTVSPSKLTSPAVNLEKKRICISIMLAFAMDSFDLDTNDCDNGIVSNKNRKREVDFFCKEIVKLGGDGREPECAVLVSQALYVMGAALMKASVEYPEIFQHMNKLLVCGLETVTKESHEIPGWEKMIHDERKLYRIADAYTAEDLSPHEQRFRVVQGAVLSSLHLLRDLTNQLCASMTETRAVRSTHEVEAAKTAYSSVINSGLEGCFAAAADAVISVDDLNIAIEILQFVVPRCQDVPIQSKRVVPVDAEIQEAMDDALFANMDVSALTGQSSKPSVVLSVDELRPTAVELVVKHLRLALQKLVIKYPKDGEASFQELFVIDLLGMIISTGDVPFSWSQVTLPSLQPRYLASRLFSAAIKYNPEREWFCNSFLSTAKSDQELANLWMMATVNTSTLDPTPLTFKGNNVTFSIAQESTSEGTAKLPRQQIRDSNCWVMLTDGIVYNILRNDNSIARSKMQPLLFDLLHRVAATCQLPRQLWLDSSATINASKLYSLHLDVFQAFAKSTGDMWRSFDSNQAAHRENIMKLRTITAGIFPTFIKAYEINLRNSCIQIAATATNLTALLQKFTSAFAPEARESFHDVDDAIDRRSLAEIKYPAVRTLITMLRFLYQCVDSLFFYCGDMAIGQDNFFTTTMERLFRQAVSAESAEARRRLARKDPGHGRITVRSAKKADVLEGCEPYIVSSVQSIQQFFARQKYPALLHWFASTSRTYLTFTPVGWANSQLRTLLVNALDSEGPLGIHSYYPMEDKRQKRRGFDVKDVRREAFYLACGLFVCQCTNSFEHCKKRHGDSSAARSLALVQEMRAFVLHEFVRESIEFAIERVDTFEEALLPLLQLLRAVLNHANLSRRRGKTANGEGASTCDFSLLEIHASFEWVTLYVAQVFRLGDAIQSELRTVLLIEYCAIVHEIVEITRVTEAEGVMARLLDLSNSLVKSVYDALSKTTLTPLSLGLHHDRIASTMVSEHLAAFDSSVSTSAGFKTAWIVRVAQNNRNSHSTGSYGVSVTRARADLLVAIRRILQLDQFPRVEERSGPAS